MQWYCLGLKKCWRTSTVPFPSWSAASITKRMCPVRAFPCLAAFTACKSRRLNEQELNFAGLTEFLFFLIDEFLFFLTSTTMLPGVFKVWCLYVLCKGLCLSCIRIPTHTGDLYQWNSYDMAKLYLVVEIHSWNRNNWNLRFSVFLQNLMDNADSFPN